MARSLDDAASKGVAGAGLGLGIAGTALGLWALVKNGGNLLGGIGGGETIIANNTLGYGAAGVSGFGYTPSEVYMSAKQCEDDEPWSVEETERARKNNNLHFTGEFSSVNKYDFNFIMNKKKAKEKYEGKSINELAYNTYKSLTDDSFPYPEAKAYFIFLTYLYGTMAEKHKLFR